MRALRAFGADDGRTTRTPSAWMMLLAQFLARRQIVFFVWVSRSEHKWVILAERRGLSPAALGISFGHRVELRPVVAVMPGPNATTSVCQANAEVFDSFSGRTSAWLSGTPAQ